jgi:hypothetical protein
MKTSQIFSLLFMLFISVSCTISSIEDFVVGDNFIKDQTGVVMIDTLTIQSSTIKYDSIISNSPGCFLVGSNYNYFSGYKNANTFMTMKFDGTIDDTEFVFDSISLVMNYSTYYSGDTTTMQTFSVYQLQEEMELIDSYLYTTNNFKCDSTPLGSVTLKPQPNSHQEVRIKLLNKFGNRLSEMIKEKNDTITTQEFFLEFFNGLVIKSQSNIKGAIVGFRTSDASTADETSTTTTSVVDAKPEIRLYYHKDPNPNDIHDLYYKFSFVTDGIYFNQISGDSSNSLIDGISATSNERVSKLTDNYTLVQSGIQIFSKLKIPYVDNLLKIGQNSALVGATLRLYPIKGTYSSSSILPDSMYVYSADRRDNLIGQITLPGSTTDYSYAQLVIQKDVEETVYYEVDLSGFIEAELDEELETNLSLMIGYGSTAAKKTAEHVILGGANSGKYSPYLSVYYYHN